MDLVHLRGDERSQNLVAKIKYPVFCRPLPIRHTDLMIVTLLMLKTVPGMSNRKPFTTTVASRAGSTAVADVVTLEWTQYGLCISTGPALVCFPYINGVGQPEIASYPAPFCPGPQSLAPYLQTHP